MARIEKKLSELVGKVLTKVEVEKDRKGTVEFTTVDGERYELDANDGLHLILTNLSDYTSLLEGLEINEAVEVVNCDDEMRCVPYYRIKTECTTVEFGFAIVRDGVMREHVYANFYKLETLPSDKVALFDKYARAHNQMVKTRDALKGMAQEIERRGGHIRSFEYVYDEGYKREYKIENQFVKVPAQIIATALHDAVAKLDKRIEEMGGNIMKLDVGVLTDFERLSKLEDLY